MTDITMCSDNSCPIRKTCFRYLATPDSLCQSYFTGKLRDEEDNCRYYWAVKSSEEVDKLNKEWK